MPERVERLVLINAVPFLPGYRWHRTARIWRRRWAGEMFMGATRKAFMRWSSREANVTPGPLPEEVIERWWRDFDQGTQRAILRLYRASPEDVLAAAGARLGEVDCPSLVVWGEQDPYLPTWLAGAYAEVLPVADARLVPGAGHWPWFDAPGVTDDVCRFLTGDGTPSLSA
jgi:pimeloyl-ACP methyl ester carboxylesterase